LFPFVFAIGGAIACVFWCTGGGPKVEIQADGEPPTAESKGGPQLNVGGEMVGAKEHQRTFENNT